MTDLVSALRAKYRTPQDALRALGLDEGLMQTKGGKPKKKSALNRVLKDAIKAKYGIAEDAALGDLLELLDALKASEQSELEIVESAIAQAKQAGATAGGEEKPLGKPAKEAPFAKGKPEGEEEESEEEEPEDKREHTDEFEEEKPANPEKDEAMAGLEPSAGMPALAETEEKKAKDNEMEESGLGGDEPAAKLHAILKDKLSPEEMQAVGEILAELAGSEEKAPGIDEEPEDMTGEDESTECAESMSGNKEDGPKAVIGGKKPAMDAKAVQMAVDAAIKAERVRQKAIRDAEDVVRPYVGASPAMSFDSAAQVYRHALGSLGVDGVDAIKDVTALKIILKSQPVPGSERRPPAEKRLGMDAAASKSFFDRFPGAARIGH